MSDTYSQRGVSADKEEVHKAIRHLDKGLFPDAFCKILPDVVAGDPGFVNIMHADTAGTKTSLAYAYWKETGDLSVWEGIAQDALVMNVDDLLCVGALEGIIISSTIGRNKSVIPGEVIERIIQANQRFCELLQSFGIDAHLAGGETADVGDIVRSIDVGITAFCRMKKEDVIRVNIQPGDLIVGLASFGQASYEQGYNGGMGSNGLTAARHDVFRKEVGKKYPETFDPRMPKHLVFSGKYMLTDEVEGIPIDIGKLVLSPTRTYAPIIKEILPKMRDSISGIIHCSGGGQTKVLHFAEAVHIVKDKLFPTPPLFSLIQEAALTGWKEMYKVFNMGHRMEIYCKPGIAEEIIEVAKGFQVDAQVVGHVETATEKQLTIKTDKGEFNYS